MQAQVPEVKAALLEVPGKDWCSELTGTEDYCKASMAEAT